MMEENYKTAASLSGNIVRSVDKKTQLVLLIYGLMAVQVSEIPNIKALVEEVLSECGMADQRPLKMSQDDFIQLLSSFNQKGIHFS